jgi:hypothetical protein
MTASNGKHLAFQPGPESVLTHGLARNDLDAPIKPESQSNLSKIVALSAIVRPQEARIQGIRAFWKVCWQWILIPPFGFSWMIA